jgi:hypothetical protein
VQVSVIRDSAIGVADFDPWMDQGRNASL